MVRICSALAFAGLLSVSLAACGQVKKTQGSKENSPTAPSGTAPATGKVGGKTWTFVSGSASPGVDASSLGLNLYDAAPAVDPTTGKPASACDQQPATTGDRVIMITVPKKTGTYTGGMGDASDQTLTFVYDDDKGSPMNDVTDNGQVIVSQINDQQVQGTLAFTFDDGNQVKGAFTATVCSH